MDDLKVIEREPSPFHPSIELTCATKRYSRARISVMSAKPPSTLCGMAVRVGYSGPCLDDFALYRLKIKGMGKAKNGRETITLPGLFILEDGIFSLAKFSD